jgi:putative salt-induced outer membrane protein YdiY
LKNSFLSWAREKCRPLFNEERRIMSYLRICCLGILLVAIIVGPVFADQVQMKNGDRITGVIVTVERGTLIINTSYAGKITIKWVEVTQVRTDSPAQVVLKDERTLEGVTQPTADGKLKLEVEETGEAVTFVLTDIEAINPEPPVPTHKVELSVNLGVEVDRGNTVKEQYKLDGKFLIRRDEHRVKLGADIEYEENFGTVTKDKGLSYLEYNYLVTEKKYYFGRSLLSYDEFKDLRRRNTIDGGLGYQFLETPLTNLFVEAGFSGVKERYTDPGGGQEFPAITWNLDYKRWFFNKHLQFFHNQRVYAALDTLDNSFFFTRTGIRIPLYKYIRWTLQFNWDWDNIPIRPVDNADTKFITRIGFKF